MNWDKTIAGLALSTLKLYGIVSDISDLKIHYDVEAGTCKGAKQHEIVHVRCGRPGKKACDLTVSEAPLFFVVSRTRPFESHPVPWVHGRRIDFPGKPLPV